MMGEIKLPEEKLLETLLKKSCTKHKLNSLIGELQHAMKPGYLRRMIVLAKAIASCLHQCIL